MRQENDRKTVYGERRQTQGSNSGPAGRATVPGKKGPMGMPAGKEPWLKKLVRVQKEHVLLAALVLCAFGVIMAVNYGQVQTLDAELSMARNAVTQANNELADLERRLQFASTEEYIDREARERFGYIKPGEIRFIPTDFGNAAQPQQVVSSQDTQLSQDSMPQWQQDNNN